MSAITIEPADGKEAFADLRDEWREVFSTAKCSPFLSWEWMSTWESHFGATGRPFVLKAYREGQMIGLIPLRKLKRIGTTRLAFVGAGPGGADYLDVVSSPEVRAEIAEALAQYLSDDASGFDLVQLENISSASPMALCLKNSESAHVRHFERETYVCPQVGLAAGWESVLKNSRRSSNFKRRLKQLEKSPGFEFRSVSSEHHLEAAFERFLVLHNKRWRGRRSELSGHPALSAFHKDVVRTMAATGLLRFDELWADGECRASIYAFDDGKTFYYYNTGFDPDWADRSVGLVLTGLSIRNAIERGTGTYDFLRGDEAYKFDWANKTAQLISLTLSNDSVAARLALGLSGTTVRLREIAKGVLPSGLAEGAKKLRWAFARRASDL